MQYEYDSAVEQLKEGRVGLEQYRGLVERVNRQVKDGETHATKLEAQAKAYLKAGDRETAGQVRAGAPEGERSSRPTGSSSRCTRPRTQNNLKKIQHANKKLVEVKSRSRSTTPSSR
jgi:hypothetical protein